MSKYETGLNEAYSASEGHSLNEMSGWYSMNRANYRKLKKGRCVGCDHPAWCPSKNVNPKRACVKCRKEATKRNKENNNASSD